jgi:hypothetical protein
VVEVVVGLVGGVVEVVVVGVVVGFVVTEVSGSVPPSPSVVVVVMVVVQAPTDTHVVTSTRSAPIDRFVCMIRLSLFCLRGPCEGATPEQQARRNRLTRTVAKRRRIDPRCERTSSSGSWLVVPVSEPLQWTDIATQGLFVSLLRIRSVPRRSFSIRGWSSGKTRRVQRNPRCRPKGNVGTEARSVPNLG